MKSTVLLILIFLKRHGFAFDGYFRPGSNHPNPGLCSSRSSTLETETFEPRIVVVGGGVGGLAVASRIVSFYNGACHVTILEKNERVGGRCGSFERVVDKYGTFRHERGPSLLLLPDTYREIFLDCCNQSAEAYGLEMKQCVPAYKVIFEDGDTIDLGFPRQPTKTFGDAERQSRETMNRWEDNGAAKWDDYMRVTSAFLDAGLSNFIEERLDLGTLPNFVIEALRDFARAWPLKPHSDVLDEIFQSNKMKALASFQDLYVGLEPYRNNELLGGGVLRTTAPAVFGLLAAIELHPSNPKSGVYAPVGGFHAVTDAMERLATDLGVEIENNVMVTKVQNDGVRVLRDSVEAFVPADLVVVNADLPYASKSILRRDIGSTGDAPPAIFDWDDSFCFSSGVISFHWSVKKELNVLNTHNVFLSAKSRTQAEASWGILRDNRGDVQPDTPFNFYVHRASQTDPTAAPVGCDSIMVLVPCRTLARDEEYAQLPREEALERYKNQFSESIIDQARQAVLARMNVLESLQNLEDFILDEVVDTPATWAEQFHVAAGTPFALSHGFAQLSLTRPSHYDASSRTVMFCGASTRPGNGVPLVLIGARQAAEKAVKRLRELTGVEPS